MGDVVRAVRETIQSRVNLARPAENPGNPSGLTRPKTVGALEQVVLPSLAKYEYKLITCQAPAKPTRGVWDGALHRAPFDADGLDRHEDGI